MESAGKFFSIEEASGYLLVKIDKQMSYRNLRTSPDSLLSLVAQKCVEFNKDKVLLTDESEEKIMMIKSYLMNESKKELGWNPNWKIAVLQTRVLDFISGKYIEQTIESRNLPIKFFMDKHEALEWLGIK